MTIVFLFCKITFKEIFLMREKMYYLNPKNDIIEKQKPQQELRSHNLKMLFDMIGTGRMTRTKLTRDTGLSAAAVTTLIDDLIAGGFVSEAGPGLKRNTGGRRPVPLKIAPQGAQIPVFSIGDKVITYTLFDLEYNVLEQSTHPCPEAEAGTTGGRTVDVGTRYADIIEKVLSGSSVLFDKASAPAILISFPGAYHDDLNVFLMTGFDVTFPAESLKELEKHIGLPVFIGNASNALAYAEKKQLLKMDADVEEMIYINVCAGVGSGIVYKDRPMPRKGELSGEIGHMTIDLGGRPCSCGNRGCLERYVSINAILQDVNRAVSVFKNENPGTLDHLPKNLTLADMGRAYEDSVEPVVQALDSVAYRLFAGIYSVVNVTGIPTIVLGGLEPLGGRFLDRLRSFHVEGMLVKDLTISYSDVTPDADSVGIAQYFIDKVFSIPLMN